MTGKNLFYICRILTVMAFIISNTTVSLSKIIIFKYLLFCVHWESMWSPLGIVS